MTHIRVPIILSSCSSHSMINQNASVQSPSSSAPVPPPPSHSSRIQARLPPLTVQPNATVLPGDSSILTPPPTAHPKSLPSSSFSQNHSSAATATHTPPLPSNHVPGLVEHGVNASIQPPTRLQNPLHVSSSNYPLQPYQQQQQVWIQENGVGHAQLAPPSWAQPPPQVVTELAAATPKLRPTTLPLEQQRHQQQQQRMMTHSTSATTTAIRPVSVSAQVRPNQSQLYPVPVQAPTRGQQPVQPVVASSVPGAPGTQARPQSAMQPYTQTSEGKRPQPVSGPSSSPSTQSQTQQRQQQHQQHQQERQQQQEQDASMPPPTIAAFRVLQPAKALLEKTWATAMDSVGREFAELNAEHMRSVHEQQRLTEVLQRCEAERVQALRSLHDAKAQLRECNRFFSFFFCG
jgi:hypothetical protein